MDLAASVQKVTEEIIILIAKISQRTGQRNLCLAGGGTQLCCQWCFVKRKDI